MTVDEIVKLLLYKVNVGSKKELVFRNFYVCETMKRRQVLKEKETG